MNIEIDSLVLTAFTRASPIERARLIGTARNFITNDGFINLLNNIDINDSKGSQIRNVCIQMRAFISVPGLKEQVVEWLRS